MSKKYPAWKKEAYKQAENEIVELEDVGHSVMRFTDWHWRVDDSIDIYPSTRKFIHRKGKYAFKTQHYKHIKDIFMAQKQDEKKALVCTYRDCKSLQTGDGEFCEKHYPKAGEKEYKVSLAVLTPENFEICVRATSEVEAFKKVHSAWENGDPEHILPNGDFISVEGVESSLDLSDYDDPKDENEIPTGAYVEEVK